MIMIKISKKWQQVKLSMENVFFVQSNNHKCLKFNRLVFCEDTGAWTMKLSVHYQLTICSFYREGGEGVTCLTLTMLQALVHGVVVANLSASMSVVHCDK